MTIALKEFSALPQALTLPAVQKPDLPVDRFMWRATGGERFYPEQMETRHIYHVVRMIWNHSMPADARSAYYKRYDFSPFYTHAYMMAALKAMCPELLRRSDLKPEWRVEMDRWREYFVRHPEMIAWKCI